MSLSEPRDVAFAKAAEAGLRVVFPASDEVQIDLDEKVFPPWFFERMRFAQDMGLVLSWKWCHSKSGNLHVVAKVDDPWLSDEARIAIQAALGSDWKRELLSVQRALRGEQDPTVLFRPRL